MSEKGRGTFSMQVFGESLESLENENAAQNMPAGIVGREMLDKRTNRTPEKAAETSTETHFSPHPPERPRDSPQNPGRVKKKKRFYRRLNRVDSNSQSSGDEKFINHKHLLDSKTTSSKLPPLSHDLSNAFETKLRDQMIDNIQNNPNMANDKGHLSLAPTMALKPLSPIKDGQNLADSFKAKQSSERGKHDLRVKGPIKPLKPIENSSALDSNEQISIKNDGKRSGCNAQEDNSESSLTSVSSDDSSDSDSNSELSPRKTQMLKTQHFPQTPHYMPPSQRHHQSSLSLNSLKDNPEQLDRHSDTEAIRRGRSRNRQSTKELWDKAKVVTLLPRVPASRARDRNSNFIKEELEKYLPEKQLMVFVGTWNMHGEKQLPIFVDDFLLPECCQFMQDIYVVGTQESTPLRKEWEIKLQEALGPSHVLIYSSAFGVLHLAIYLRRELVWFCSAVEQATVATRPGHMIKTKGAIGVSLSIFGTSFLFINSHFTAHEQKWKERIGDYRLIKKTLSLPLNYSEATNDAIDVTARFNQVFWLGDFNFRVEERHGVVEKFLRQCKDDEDPNYEELVAKDQMTKLMKKNGVFEHFKEAKINFAPTYRFEINPDDPGLYSSIRVPSWTDRIVYRSSMENGVWPLHYDSCSTLNISDHRPVYGIFEATIKPIKERISFTGVHFVRDVYIEANRRRAAPPRNQRQTAVCIIL